MTKVLVLYYSAWGHMEQMAYAAADGAREAGAEVDVKRVPELVPGRCGEGRLVQDGPEGPDRHAARTREL